MSSLAAAIEALVVEAIARQVFPGAVVLVARRGALLHAAAYGSTMYADAGSAPVTLQTRYDVASLTKVFTATAALQLVDEQLVALDDPVVRFLPALRASDITLRHLLTHTSGLALQLSALRTGGADAILAAVYAAQPTTAPGSRAVYSNVSSLLLGEVVAHVRGLPLDSVIEQFVLAPLGMRGTGFRPPVALLAQIAPTEWDDTWRNRLVHGSVHDESAFALGGVAGHAGLFSSAHDLMRFCQAWLSSGYPLLQPTTAALAIQNHTPGLELACGLGWMLQRPHFMGAAAPECYGHTGFTGPALVLAPRHHTAIVFLTNRTYPRRATPAHHAVIARIAELTISAYGATIDHRP